MNCFGGYVSADGYSQLVFVFLDASVDTSAGASEGPVFL